MAKRTELDQAVQPFVSLYKIMEPLDLPDDRPVQAFAPGVWPTWGDLKRLYDALPAKHKEWRRR